MSLYDRNPKTQNIGSSITCLFMSLTAGAGTRCLSLLSSSPNLFSYYFLCLFMIFYFPVFSSLNLCFNSFYPLLFIVYFLYFLDLIFFIIIFSYLGFLLIYLPNLYFSFLDFKSNSFLVGFGTILEKIKIQK